jgi:sulfatase maturation enzyme AslB (radical SAM superfamily)
MNPERNVRYSGNIAELNAPVIVSVLLNDICNLRCQTCYLENMDEPNSFSRREWNRFFESLFGDLKPNASVFVGKEVFAKDESVETMFDALEQRDRLQAQKITDIGVITNGTLLQKYKGRLERSSLDWIDISIDGPREFNDKIRGEGSYSKLERSLEWLSQSFQGDRLWVVPTLCDANSTQIAQMIEDLNKTYGINHYSIGLYKHRSSAPDLFSVGDGEVSRFVNDLSKIEVNSTTEVVLGYKAENPDYYSAMFNLPNSLSETVTKKEIDLGNLVRLNIQRNNRNIGLWRAVRVSSEGDWLAAEDLFDHLSYKQNAVTNLRDVGYDSRKAYEIGLQSPRARSLGFVQLEVSK